MPKQAYCWRVLVVEDEPLIAMHLEAALTALGVREIRCACSLNAGIRALQDMAPDLALLDVDLDGTPVFPLAEMLRIRQVPILFTSARALAELPQEWSRYPFLPKPLIETALVAALRALCAADIVESGLEA